MLQAISTTRVHSLQLPITTMLSLKHIRDLALFFAAVPGAADAFMCGTLGLSENKDIQCTYNNNPIVSTTNPKFTLKSADILAAGKAATGLGPNLVITGCGGVDDVAPWVSGSWTVVEPAQGLQTAVTVTITGFLDSTNNIWAACGATVTDYTCVCA